MKRLHVHTTVSHLEPAIRFYSTLFGQAPSLREADYAKWMLEDPRVNFAISTWGKKPGIDHLGFQVEDDGELAEIATRLENAGHEIAPEKSATCCYAVSDKHWVVDPAGTPWETFRTMAQVKTRGTSQARAEAEAAALPSIPVEAADQPASKSRGSVCCA